MEKLNKTQLVETIRDAIFEVLEEEIDLRLNEAKKAKAKRINESKAKLAKKNRELKALVEKKEKLKKFYKKLNEQEKALRTKKDKNATK